MVVLDIICRMPNSADVQLIEGCVSTFGTVEYIKKECVDWHRKKVEEICPGDEILIMKVY